MVYLGAKKILEEVERVRAECYEHGEISDIVVLDQELEVVKEHFNSANGFTTQEDAYQRAERILQDMKGGLQTAKGGEADELASLAYRAQRLLGRGKETEALEVMNRLGPRLDRTEALIGRYPGFATAREIYARLEKEVLEALE